MNNIPDHILSMAREQAAQAWCTEETKSMMLDPVITEAFARILALWLNDLARERRNTAYYQGLLDEIGKTIGKEAHTADDGTVSNEPLRAKLPELVKKLTSTSVVEKVRLEVQVDTSKIRDAIAAYLPDPTVRTQRLVDAVEGECEGLAISPEVAAKILDYLDTGELPRT